MDRRREALAIGGDIPPVAIQNDTIRVHATKGTLIHFH